MGRRYIGENIAENIPNAGKETGFRIQEAQRIPLTISKNRSTPHHLIVKLTSLRDKEKILKAAWDKMSVTSKGRNTTLAADYPQRPGRPEKTGMIYSEH